LPGLGLVAIGFLVGFVMPRGALPAFAPPSSTLASLSAARAMSLHPSGIVGKWVENVPAMIDPQGLRSFQFNADGTALLDGVDEAPAKSMCAGRWFAPDGKTLALAFGPGKNCLIYRYALSGDELRLTDSAYDNHRLLRQ
jgi:hypothetical protein